MVRQIKPMLVYKTAPGKSMLEEVKKIYKSYDWRWICEEKKDGSRYLMHFFKHKYPILTGRRTSVVTGNFTEVKVSEKLPQFAIKHHYLDGTVLDGEYMGTSAASIKKCQYFAFDCLFYRNVNVMDYPLSLRKRFTESVVKLINSLDSSIPIVTLEWKYVLDWQEVLELFEETVKKGGEGLVLKNVNSKYIPGKRSRNFWVKLKKKETFDVVIMGLKKSSSKKYGTSGFNTFRHLIAGQYKNGELVEVCHIPATSFTDHEHSIMSKQGVQKLMGKVAEVEAMERLKIKLRHPRFMRWRDDKNPEECLLE
jgi:ATP-dependent DNA ligase